MAIPVPDRSMTSFSGAGGSLGFRIVSIKENSQNINWLRNGNETRICKSKQQKNLN
jgi:hypothetical protein